MPGLDCDFDPLHQTDYEDESIWTIWSFYNLLILLTGLTIITYTLARYAEFKNELNYDNRTARIIAGFLKLITQTLHSGSGDLVIDNPENKLIAVGPHRTVLDAIVVASKINGTPPRFFATTAFDALPGIRNFLKMFKTIPVEAHPTKRDNTQSANANALEIASQALHDKGCVVLFPQGNFSNLGQEPPRVYTGAAKLALKNKVPIHVIRLDGYWCLQNPFIPLFVRNNKYYRAFLSMFHMNNIRTILCRVIDIHLQPENNHLSDEDKIDEICAQLYAYYRHTQELNPKQIDTIKNEISHGRHRLIWENKVKRDTLEKNLFNLKKEIAELEEKTFASLKMG